MEFIDMLLMCVFDIIFYNISIYLVNFIKVVVFLLYGLKD